MTEFTVNLTNVTTCDAFYAAFNDAFIREFGGDWNGHLDAFNDYLYWPCYDAPDGYRYRLTIVGWPACAAALHDELTRDGRRFTDMVKEILLCGDNREYVEVAFA